MASGDGGTRKFWSARERTVIANMENYLDESDDMKLEVGELELLMGPGDSGSRSDVHPDACKKEWQHDFRDPQYEREK